MRTNTATGLLVLVTTITLTACPSAKDEEGGKDSGAERGETETTGDPKPAVKTEPPSK
jgi:hypothetical protein